MLCCGEFSLIVKFEILDSKERLEETIKILKNEFDIISKNEINKQIDELYICEFLLNLIVDLLNKNEGVIDTSGYLINDNQAEIWLAYNHIELTKKAIESVLNLFNYVYFNNDIKKDYIQDFKTFSKKYHFHNKQLLQFSKKYDIPSFSYLPFTKYWQYGWGENSILFNNSSSIKDSHIGVQISTNKLKSKQLLESFAMPIAKSIIIKNKDELQTAIKSIGYPCVLKPIKGADGIGVTANILKFEELENAFDYTRNSIYNDSLIMIEKFIEGNDYRLIVVKNEFMLALERKPSYILGDGISNIEELIQRLNKNRKKPLSNPKGHKQIKIDKVLISFINKYNYNLNSVLEKDKKLKLSSLANFSNGGIIEDVTKNIHNDVKNMAEIIASNVDIDIFGMDYITKDITKSPFDTKEIGVITEYNHYLEFGSISFVENNEKILKKILGDNIGRIPILLFIVKDSDRKNIIKWLIETQKEDTTAYAYLDKIYLGNISLKSNLSNDWSHIENLLKQKKLKKGIIFCHMDEIINKGLPIDKLNTIYIDDLVNFSSEWIKVFENSSTNLEFYNDINDMKRY